MANIQIMLRIRPPGSNPAMPCTQDASSYYGIDYSDNIVKLKVPMLQTSAYQISLPKTDYNFQFQHIFDSKQTQEDVYKKLVSPMIPDFLNGYNCCVFVYGQTGSGKTHTITGGATSYSERGLMPRAIEHLFSELQNSTRVNEVYATYCQILNEGGFDLLSTGNSPYPGMRGTLEDLKKVTFNESQEGDIVVKNLSAHRAESIEDMLNILWQGDTNRVVTATSQNEASSRSHCIFTMIVRSREPTSDVIRQSKFHFVDLAGSERVSKTKSTGETLNQANYINTSLFHLEVVIQALSRKMRDPTEFVPYRSTTMTFFLKDSLGGNCRTAMLSCIGVEPFNMPESISTCQFAMAVGSIKNVAVINEDIDPKLLIKRLKAENLILKEQLKLLKEGIGTNANSDITQAEREDIFKLCRVFLATISQETLEVGSWFKIQVAFRFIRELYNQKEGSAPSQALAGPTDSAGQVARLKQLLQQRDAEIEILTQMVSGVPVAHQLVKSPGPNYDYNALEHEYESRDASVSKQQEFRADGVATPKLDNGSLTTQPPAMPKKKEDKDGKSEPPPKPTGPSEHEQYLKVLSSAANICGVDLKSLTVEKLKDEAAIFQQFLKTYYRNDRIQEDKRIQKELYKQAKELAALIQSLKAQAEETKSQILQIVEKLGRETEESDVLKGMLKKISGDYQEAVKQLKLTKTQIEAVDADVSRGKADVKKDFLKWYSCAAQYVANNQVRQMVTKRDQETNEEIDRSIQQFYKLKNDSML